MNAKELIKLLKTAIKEKGDLEVRLQTETTADPDWADDSVRLAGFININDNYFLLCDDDTMDATEDIR